MSDKSSHLDSVIADGKGTMQITAVGLYDLIFITTSAETVEDKQTGRDRDRDRDRDRPDRQADKWLD